MIYSQQQEQELRQMVDKYLPSPESIPSKKILGCKKKTTTTTTKKSKKRSVYFSIDHDIVSSKTATDLDNTLHAGIPKEAPQRRKPLAKINYDIDDEEIEHETVFKPSASPSSKKKKKLSSSRRQLRHRHHCRRISRSVSRGLERNFAPRKTETDDHDEEEKPSSSSSSIEAPNRTTRRRQVFRSASLGSERPCMQRGSVDHSGPALRPYRQISIEHLTIDSLTEEETNSGATTLFNSDIEEDIESDDDSTKIWNEAEQSIMERPCMKKSVSLKHHYQIKNSKMTRYMLSCPARKLSIRNLEINI